MKKLWIISLLIFSSCASPATKIATPTAPIIDSAQTEISPALTEAAFGSSDVDVLANLPEPTCEKGLTPADQEGPYFKADSPERTSLIEDGMEGKKLILAGYVLTAECFPVPHALLDFWQANAKGEYDNAGFKLRGHQYTDNKGRYYLETIMPGIYPERPIEHIHVKVQIPGRDIFTTQLYFPAQPIDGLTISLEDQGNSLSGYFNFVLK